MFGSLTKNVSNFVNKNILEDDAIASKAAAAAQNVSGIGQQRQPSPAGRGRPGTQPSYPGTPAAGRSRDPSPSTTRSSPGQLGGHTPLAGNRGQSPMSGQPKPGIIGQPGTGPPAVGPSTDSEWSPEEKMLIDHLGMNPKEMKGMNKYELIQIAAVHADMQQQERGAPPPGSGPCRESMLIAAIVDLPGISHNDLIQLSPKEIAKIVAVSNQSTNEPPPSSYPQNSKLTPKQPVKTIPQVASHTLPKSQHVSQPVKQPITSTLPATKPTQKTKSAAESLTATEKKKLGDMGLTMDAIADFSKTEIDQILSVMTESENPNSTGSRNPSRESSRNTSPVRTQKPAQINAEFEKNLSQMSSQVSNFFNKSQKEEETKREAERKELEAIKREEAKRVEEEKRQIEEERKRQEKAKEDLKPKQPRRQLSEEQQKSENRRLETERRLAEQQRLLEEEDEEEEERLRIEAEKRKADKEKRREQARKLEEERVRLEEERIAEEERWRKEEEERLRREEEERLRKLEEERLRKLEEERLRKLEEERLRKIEEERLRKIEEERLRKIEEERLRKIEEERLRLEEEERLRREEEERLRREEEERLRKEEEERLRREEEERKRREEEERLRKEEEERKRKEEEERLRKEEEERLRKIEEERHRKEEEERIRREEEERKKREIEAKRRREEEERIKREEEEMFRREEEERKRREDEKLREKERLLREEDERKRYEEARRQEEMEERRRYEEERAWREEQELRKREEDFRHPHGADHSRYHHNHYDPLRDPRAIAQLDTLEDPRAIAQLDEQESRRQKYNDPEIYFSDEDASDFTDHAEDDYYTDHRNHQKIRPQNDPLRASQSHLSPHSHGPSGIIPPLSPQLELPPGLTEADMAGLSPEELNMIMSVMARAGDEGPVSPLPPAAMNQSEPPRRYSDASRPITERDIEPPRRASDASRPMTEKDITPRQFERAKAPELLEHNRQYPTFPEDNHGGYSQEDSRRGGVQADQKSYDGQVYDPRISQSRDLPGTDHQTYVPPSSHGGVYENLPYQQKHNNYKDEITGPSQFPNSGTTQHASNITHYDNVPTQNKSQQQQQQQQEPDIRHGGGGADPHGVIFTQANINSSSTTTVYSTDSRQQQQYYITISDDFIRKL